MSETHTIVQKTIIYGLTQAGGCLDGKQHLSLGEMAGSSGMKSLADAIGGGNMGKIKKPKNPKNKDEDDAKKATVFLSVNMSRNRLRLSSACVLFASG